MNDNGRQFTTSLLAAPQTSDCRSASQKPSRLTLFFMHPLRYAALPIYHEFL